MDVLQLIKTEHQGIRSLVAKLSESGTITARRKLISDIRRQTDIHLHLEGDYLYPEINDLFNGADRFVKKSKACHRNINRSLNEVEKLVNTRPQPAKSLLDRKISQLQIKLNEHFETEEENLMPKMRSMIPTQDREDLGQVFLDAGEHYDAKKRRRRH